MVQDIGLNGVKYYHVIFIIGSILLIISPFIDKRTFLLIIGLILIHIAAIATGLETEFHLNHHIIRGIISAILIFTSLKVI